MNVWMIGYLKTISKVKPSQIQNQITWHLCLLRTLHYSLLPYSSCAQIFPIRNAISPNLHQLVPLPTPFIFPGDIYQSDSFPQVICPLLYFPTANVPCKEECSNRTLASLSIFPVGKFAPHNFLQNNCLSKYFPWTYTSLSFFHGIFTPMKCSL